MIKKPTHQHTKEKMTIAQEALTKSKEENEGKEEGKSTGTGVEANTDFFTHNEWKALGQ